MAAACVTDHRAVAHVSLLERNMVSTGAPGISKGTEEKVLTVRAAQAAPIRMAAVICAPPDSAASSPAAKASPAPVASTAVAGRAGT